jgi:glycolate oxidase FAD binding subunit
MATTDLVRCGLVRAASATDEIAGVPARLVARPINTEQAAAVLRAAARDGLAVVFRGAGTRRAWGAPPRRLDLIVDTTALTGVAEHAAGDLIAVVRAGTRLAEVAALLAPAGQQLALDDPPVDGVDGAPTERRSTVGGMVAVNASGPRRMAYGTVRDLLIGVTVVRADGAVARAGGKVVKNVAGYDVGKLVTGSYGTLALITECVFRLHPVPPESVYVRRRVRDAQVAGRLAAAVRGAQVVPSALEVDAPAGGGYDVTVLLEGTRDGVGKRSGQVVVLMDDPPGAVGIGNVTTEPPPGWGTYPWRAGDVGLKLTGALSRVPSLLAAARTAGDRHGAAVSVRGSAGVGVFYAGLPGDTDPAAAAGVVDDLRAAAREAAGHAVVLTAPPAVRERVDLWGPVDGLELMRRVKHQFDPDARLAPGRFVGGI